MDTLIVDKVNEILANYNIDFVWGRKGKRSITWFRAYLPIIKDHIAGYSIAKKSAFQEIYNVNKEAYIELAKLLNYNPFYIDLN